MKPKDGKTSSCWTTAAAVPTYSPLTSNLETDVCVVGAGIAGLTTAYLLARENVRVIVVDDGPVAGGQTGRTSAHLASAIDDRFYSIRDEYGEDAARICRESHAAAIDTIETIQAREQVDCDFERLDGFLFLASGDDVTKLERELAAAQLAGCAGVERLDRVPMTGFDSDAACLRFPRQARFHPLKYMAGLCRALEKLGVKIHCGNRITEVHGGNVDRGELCRSVAEQGPTIASRAVVVATNTPAPIPDWQGIYTKQAAYRTYVVALRVPKGSVGDALYWDTLDDAYHYVRLDPSSGDEDHDTLIVGGEDHKVGQFEPDAAPFLRLETWARKHFPSARDVTFRWSGQVQEPVDGIAFIGRAPTEKPNVHVITGDSGMGLTHGTLGAMLVRDLILGRECEWESLYDPSRKMTGAIAEYVKENANAASKFVDYLTGGEVESVDEIPTGQGAIVRDGLKKLAIFRDEHGQVHRRSAVCTHMGCIVQWNHVEQTWDCPCHGSRFDAQGGVVMGPAVSDLSAAEE